MSNEPIRLVREVETRSEVTFSAGLRRNVAPVWYEMEERRQRHEWIAKAICGAVLAGWAVYFASKLPW